jgi:hypothetical protein
MSDNIYTINYKKTIAKHLSIIAIGVFIFYIDEVEFLNLFFPKLFLLLVAVAKSVYFAMHSIRKIEDASEHNITYNKFIEVILVNISVIVLSFAVDFTCLFLISKWSFAGMVNQTTIFNLFFDFIYFSALTFATVGFGDIIPISSCAKILVLMEVLLSFFTIIIVISNFAHVKESVKEYSFLSGKKRPLAKTEAPGQDITPRQILKKKEMERRTDG